MITLVLLLCACHFIGDYPFQSEWFANFKGKSWEVCFYHSAVYASTFIIFAHAGLAFALLLLVSHIIIDSLKARWNIIKTIWQDQLLHAVIIASAIVAGIT